MRPFPSSPVTTPTASFNPRLGRWTVWVGGRTQYRYRWLMEQHLGRTLATDEHVHHINGDPADDRIENLQVLSASEHRELHAADGVNGIDGWSIEFPACVECATTERPHTAHGLCERCYSRIYQRRTKGHAPRRTATVLDLTCGECGQPFRRTLRQGHARFCSRSCASRATATARWARVRAEKDARAEA